jgi:hypothetical protein
VEFVVNLEIDLGAPLTLQPDVTRLSGRTARGTGSGITIGISDGPIGQTQS